MDPEYVRFSSFISTTLELLSASYISAHIWRQACTQIISIFTTAYLYTSWILLFEILLKYVQLKYLKFTLNGDNCYVQ
jgi:hypothetical protein